MSNEDLLKLENNALENLLNEVIEVGRDMRKKQVNFFNLRKSKNLPFNDPIVTDALHKSIEAEKHFDELIKIVKVIPTTQPTQTSLFQ